MAHRVLLSVLAVAALAACGEMARLPVDAGVGPDPQLPAPNKTLIPTVNVATVEPWASTAQPRSAPGTSVNAFATGLEHPRWLLVLPNGDVLVA
jgi:glucose/arabinose dehydrogenase